MIIYFAVLATLAVLALWAMVVLLFGLYDLLGGLDPGRPISKRFTSDELPRYHLALRRKDAA